MESEEEYDFQDSLGGVFSTEMFETNLRIEGEMRAEEDAAKPPTCSICFEELSDLPRGMLDSCDHLYCFECITEWSSRENTCPCCKKRFKRIEKVDIEGQGQVKDKEQRVFRVRKKTQRNSPSYRTAVANTSHRRRSRRSQTRPRRSATNEVIVIDDVEEEDDDDISPHQNIQTRRRSSRRRRRLRRVSENDENEERRREQRSARNRRASRRAHQNQTRTSTSTSQWPCSVCTFLNDDVENMCGMCETPRVVVVVSPAPAPTPSTTTSTPSTATPTPSTTSTLSDTILTSLPNVSVRTESSNSRKAKKSRGGSSFVWIKSSSTGQWIRGRRRGTKAIGIDDDKDDEEEKTTVVSSSSSPSPLLCSTVDITSNSNESSRSSNNISSVLESMENLISSVSRTLSSN